jgi:hypothetical protein
MRANTKPIDEGEAVGCRAVCLIQRSGRDRGDSNRRDVAVREMAGRARRRARGTARDRRGDDADDEDGVPGRGRLCPHDQVRRPGRQLEQDGGLLEVTARPTGNRLWVIEVRVNPLMPGTPARPSRSHLHPGNSREANGGRSSARARAIRGMSVLVRNGGSTRSQLGGRPPVG